MMGEAARSPTGPTPCSLTSSERFSLISPIGLLDVAVAGDGAVVAIDFNGSAKRTLSSVHPGLSAAFDGYFERGDELSAVPARLSVSDFHRSVLEVLRIIPPGQVRTYAEVAAEVGRPRAARAVGGACASNPIPIIFPCHRVVGSTGLGGYQNGLLSKLLLLKREGYRPSQQVTLPDLASSFF